MKLQNSNLNLVVIFSLLFSNLVWAPVRAGRVMTGVELEPDEGNTLYVKPGGTGDCSSWVQACGLQTALEEAVSGDQIWVARGVYKPTDSVYTSCQDVQIARPGAPDGEYMLNVAGNGFMVWCADMAGAPREYLMLAYDNYSQYTAGGSSPGIDVRTTYGMVRLLPDTLQVDIGDQRYADSTGLLAHSSIVVTSMPYAVAMDCVGTSSSTGVARIDLQDTPFAVAPEETFILGGYLPGGTAVFSAERQVVELTGGGFCGWIQPGPDVVPDPFNDTGGPILELSYLHPSWREQLASFRLKSGVALYGGFDPDVSVDNFAERNPAAYPTVLSGDIDANDITTPDGVVTDTANLRGYNSYHVVIANTDTLAILDGFTLTAGNANSSVYPNMVGGGMYNQVGSSPEIRNVTFSGNSGQSGGGMYISGASSPVLTNVAFNMNAALTYGGGIDNHGNPSLSAVSFNHNTAGAYGGGMRNYIAAPELTGATFNGNYAVLGGGMYNDSDSHPLLTDVIFTGNSAKFGGGMAYGTTSTLTNVAFNGNTADTYGGGIIYNGGSHTLSGVTFSANEANIGGGMYIKSSEVELTEVTFDGNIALSSGGGMVNEASSPILTDVTFKNNLSFGEGGGMVNVVHSSPILTDGRFSGNSATHGGGMYNEDSSSPTVIGVTFSGNTASTSGGGMFNVNNSSPVILQSSFYTNTAVTGGGLYFWGCSTPPSLTNVLFNGNVSTGTEADQGGGGLYSQDCDPEITNTTFVHNQAASYGGGVFATGTPFPSLRNSLLWGNSGVGALDDQQYHPYPPSMVFNTTIQASATDPSPFSDADGADGVPGTGDDDLRPTYPASYADGAVIDGGNETYLPADSFDLDGDSNDWEYLPLDLAGGPRLFADYDLDGEADPAAELEADLLNQVDRGAFEGEYGWYMTYGDERLSAGREYRTGFRDSRTLEDTLADYSLQPFRDAERAYLLALGRSDTPPGIDLAEVYLTRLDIAWEIATGELLAGNDDMLKTQDMRFSAALPALEDHISYQADAREHFATAVLAYLVLLAEDLNQFLALQPGRISYLDLDSPEPNPYHDVQRLAQAAAKESLAYVTLAQSYFRQNTAASRTQAEETLRAGHDRAGAMLALLERLTRDWGEAETNTAYATARQALLQNIAELERLTEYLQQGKNPFGYHEGYIPFMIRYDNSADPETVWNFLNVYEEAYTKTDSYFDLADQAHDELLLVARQLDEDQNALETALSLLVTNYWEPLDALCGSVGAELDLAGCAGGDIYAQVLVIQAALTRLRQAELAMENQLELVRIEQQRAAEVAGIHRATAIMYTQDGQELADLARDEANLKFSKSDLGMGLDILGAGLSGFIGGAELGQNFNPASGLLFGGLNMALQAGKNLDERATARELGDIAARREEIDARQKARVEYAEAEIVDANSEALIKEYLLEYATLELDRAIAYNALQQELHCLNAMTAQVEYLLARWAEAKRDVFEIYSDPGARLFRDWLSEDAQAKYDLALEWAFRTGRALDYEMGADWAGAGDIYEIVSIDVLENAYGQMNTDFNAWKPAIPPEPAYTAIPLSQALGYADSYEVVAGVPVYTTAREKFTAYASDPANWLDLDKDGTSGSLRLTFQTSIFNSSAGLNLFSTGVFNDKILRVAPVLVGDPVHLDPDQNHTSVRIKQRGTCYLRSQDAVIGGQDSFKAYDFEHAFGEAAYPEARLNSYNEWINQENLAKEIIDVDGSLGLLWRSVGCTDWVLTIAREGIDAENSDLDFAYLEDILLFVKHRNFALSSPDLAASFAAPSDTGPKPAPQLLASAEAAYRYSGTLLPEQSGHMRPEPLTLYLEQSGSAAAGVIEVDGLLGFPDLDGEGTGPALSGTVADGMFFLESEVYAGAGGITRTLSLTTTAVYSEGALIRGEYTQAILGLVPETIRVQGVFTLTQEILTPLASFSAIPGSGPAPLPVTFLDWSQGAPTSYLWDFGDGSTATEANPTHVYVAPGLYTVSLTVENLFGSNTLIETDLVAVSEPSSPVAYLSADPLSGPVPLTVSFTDLSAGGPTEWSWDFGDGGTSTLKNPTHIYTEAGLYTLTLTVSNPLGTDTLILPEYIHVYVPEEGKLYLPMINN